GREPALWASTPGPPWMRAKASAIWLRQEFSTQTKRMRLRPSAGGSGASTGDLQRFQTRRPCRRILRGAAQGRGSTPSRGLSMLYAKVGGAPEKLTTTRPNPPAGALDAAGRAGVQC